MTGRTARVRFIEPMSTVANLHTFSCLSVLHNAVVAWNMVHIKPVVEQLRAEGQRCDDMSCSA